MVRGMEFSNPSGLDIHSHVLGSIHLQQIFLGKTRLLGGNACLPLQFEMTKSTPHQIHGGFSKERHYICEEEDTGEQ